MLLTLLCKIIQFNIIMKSRENISKLTHSPAPLMLIFSPSKFQFLFKSQSQHFRRTVQSSLAVHLLPGLSSRQPLGQSDRGVAGEAGPSVQLVSDPRRQLQSYVRSSSVYVILPPTLSGDQNSGRVWEANARRRMCSCAKMRTKKARECTEDNLQTVILGTEMLHTLRILLVP